MMRTLLTFAALALLAGAGSGCAASHRARAEAHDRRASRELDTGHPIKAVKEKARAADERDRARDSIDHDLTD